MSEGFTLTSYETTLSERDRVYCRLEYSRNQDDSWVSINPNETDKVVLDISGSNGTITFDGYWYTKGFKEYLDSFHDKEKPFRFVETFEQPKRMELMYVKHEGTHSEVKQRRRLPFPYHFKTQEEVPKEIIEASPLEDVYVFKAEYAVGGEIDVYKREVFEDTSGEGFEDDEYPGCRIVLTPTYMNKLWFKKSE